MAERKSSPETGTIRSDGSFSFPGLEIVAGRLYAVTTEHQGVLYASEIGAFESRRDPSICS